MRSVEKFSEFYRIQGALALCALGILGLMMGCGGGSSTVAVVVTPSASNVIVGKTQQFTATVYGSTNTTVAWSVTESGGGTVDSSGNYTAPMKAGTYHVVATSAAKSTASASAPVAVVVPQPVFTSTPTTAAAQDTPYSYTLAATDPAGTAVNFALTSAPDGATLSGSAVSWTPSGQQARQNNAFLVTATSAAGGTATQAWAVAPTGTIQGSLFINHWSADGTVGIEDNPATNSIYQWAALVPQSDGSLSVLPGTGSVDATFEIPGVPAGYYWVQFHPGEVIWTNDSVFEYGSDTMGRIQLPITVQIFGCNLTGLDPWDPNNDQLLMFSVNAQAFAAFIGVPQGGGPNPFPVTGSTDCNQAPSFPFDIGGITGIPGDVTSTVQFEANNNSLTLFDHAQVVGPTINQPMTVEAAYPPIQGPPSQTTTVSGALTTTQTVTQDFTIPFSQWESAFNAGGPTPSASPQLFEVELTSEQQAAGLARTNPVLFGDSPNLVFVAADSNSAWPKDTNGNNVWPQDGDLGSLSYNNPFTAAQMGVNFTPVYIVTVAAEYTVPLPGSSSPMHPLLPFTLTTPTLPNGFAPGIQPVGNPQVNGTSLFAATTVPTVSPTITWTAPASTAPVLYSISICAPQTSSDCSSPNDFSYNFGNYTQTSFTVPPGILTPGQTYVFFIQSDSRTGYDPLHPNRYSLPEATAYSVSAAITVDANATAGVVHGDRALMAPRVVPQESAGQAPGTVSAKPTYFVSQRPLWVVSPQQQQSATQSPAQK